MKTLQASLIGLLFISLFSNCGSIVHSDAVVSQAPGESAPIEMHDSVVYYLPRGIIKVDGVWDKDKGYVVTITPEIYADRNARYRLTLNNRYPFFDNNATLTVNAKGLLQTVTGVSADHTVDAAVSLVSAAGSALSFGAALGGGGAPGLRDVTQRPFHVVLDPYNFDKTEEEVENFRIAVTEAKQAPVSPPPADKSMAGVLTRLLVPFIVSVTPTTDGDNRTQRATVVLPDRSQTHLLRIPRAPFVTNETTVQFSDGSLTSWDMKRPSVVYGIINIPKNILAALVPIPGNVRQQQVSKIEATKTILSDEAAIKKLQESQ